MPLLPVIVTVIVPAVALLDAVIVIVDVPLAGAGFGEYLAVILDGNPVVLKVTLLPAPMAASVIVAVVWDPRVTEVVDGAEMLKLPTGAEIVTDTVVVCKPELPEIVRL